ncbi:MAG: hypothetical protein HW386_1247 [Gammaproteobacteria bacterium]|nr:hypothetical protein [Gammaproteobacteria bacterium]
MNHIDDMSLSCMNMNHCLGIFWRVVIITGLFPCALSAAVQSDLTHFTASHFSSLAAFETKLYMAQADEPPQQDPQPKSGTLVLPSDYEKQKDAKEQTCVRVCSDWGETCVYDVRKGRKCRRTCKETTMECFEQ